MAWYLTICDLVPTFRVERENGETYALTGDIPAWESNGLHLLSSLQEAIILPESYSLAAAYPNPFNPTTTINFTLPKLVKVRLEVYNVNGQLVCTLMDTRLDVGSHSVTWDGSNYSSGIYFLNIVAGEFVDTQKLMVVK